MESDGRPGPALHTVRVDGRTWDRVLVLQDVFGLHNATDVVVRLVQDAVTQIDPKSIAKQVEDRLHALR